MDTTTWLSEFWPLVAIPVLVDCAAILSALTGLEKSNEGSGEKYSKTAMAWITLAIGLFAIAIALKQQLPGHKDPAWLGECKVATSGITAIILIILTWRTVLTMKMMRKHWEKYRPAHFL